MFFMRPVRSFVFGLTLPARSARFILAKPSLLGWSIFPVILTLVLYYFVISWLQTETQTLVMDYYARWAGSTEGWGAAVVLILSKVMIFLAAALTFSFTSTLLASPFNDFLAESAEKHSTPALPPHPGGGFQHQLRTLWIDVVKAGASGIMGIAALLLSWVPLLNILSFGLVFLLVCFQYISYPQTRRGVTLGHSVFFLFRHLPACLGFGAAISFLFAIPFVSSLALPVAVVGGTLLFAELRKDPSR